MMPKRVALKTRIYFGTIPTIKYVNEEGPYEVSFDVGVDHGATAIALLQVVLRYETFLGE